MINKISIKRSVFSVRMKMVSTAIAMIASSKSLRWCKNDFHGLNDFMQTKKGDWSSRQRFAQSCSAVFTFALLAKCRVAQQSTCTLVFDFCTGGSGAVLHTFHRAWLHWAAAAAGPVLNHTDLHQCNKFTLRSPFRLYKLHKYCTFL